MEKLKKRKLALATAIVTLTASLSVFSSVPASAWNLREYVVLSIDVSDGTALVIPTDERPVFYKWNDDSPERVFCCKLLWLYSDPLSVHVIERAEYGDVIRFSGKGDIGQTEIKGVNDIVYDFDTSDSENNTFEIVGSVFDAPPEHFGAVTMNGQTFMQVTLDDGTKFVVEDGITIEDIDKMLAQKPATEYEEGHCPVWVLPNEDGDVNSDDKVDSADAAVLLEEIALSAVGETGRMNASENQAADVNGDGIIDAQDAAVILSYSAEIGSGMLEGVTLKAYAAQ
ncbi:MAG: hypothetical protein K2O42_00180 [Oscillospiraceae bacterium]|nr:hypothetical protein [Oscillospiraceae bacterium]